MKLIALKTPGPAAYQLPDPNIYLRRSACFSVTGRHYLPNNNNNTKPGPASHFIGQVGWRILRSLFWEFNNSNGNNNNNFSFNLFISWDVFLEVFIKLFWFILELNIFYL